MRRAATLRWIGLAVLGIAIAVAVAIAASSLASRQIGLASEPIEAGKELAPATVKPRRRAPGPQPQREAAPAAPASTTPTAPAPPPATTPTVEARPPAEGDDSGGRAAAAPSHGADD